MMDPVMLDFYYNNIRTEYILDVVHYAIDNLIRIITYLEQLRATLKVGC